MLPSPFGVRRRLHLGFPGSTDGKESPCNARDLDSIPGFGRSPRGGHGNPLQYSCLENTMDRGAWQSTAHGFQKSRTRLSRTRKICFLYMTLRNHTNILKLLAFFFFHILNDISRPVSPFSSTGHFTSQSLCLLISHLNSCLSVRQR